VGSNVSSSHSRPVCMCPRLSARSRPSHPSVEIALLPLKWWEQDAPLRDGRADVGYLRRPFDDTGLRTIAVGGETKVACLPVTHPLARRRALTMADLDG